MFSKRNILIFESLSHIAGGQRVLLNILPYLKDDFLITVVVPSTGTFSQALIKMGINVKFINPGNYSARNKDALDIFKYLLLFPINLIKSFWLVKNSDLIYVNSTRVLPNGLLGGIIFKKPVIWHNHSLIGDNKTRIALNFLTRLNSLKKIIAVSGAVAEQFLNLFNKTEILYNGIDLNKFKPEEQKVEMMSKNIVVVGDLMPTKGQDFLIKAIASLKNINYKLKIIGSARTGMEYYEAELKELIKSFCLESKIEFLGRRDDIDVLLQGADLLILPATVSEACPMAVLEAMACGVPVIVSDLGGTKEIVKDDYTGYTFKTGDQKDLINKINKFFSLSSEIISEMKSNCRYEAELKYNLENNANEIKRTINEVLE